jgi:hypothetical protein
MGIRIIGSSLAEDAGEQLDRFWSTRTADCGYCLDLCFIRLGQQEFFMKKETAKAVRSIQKAADDLWTHDALLVPEYNIDYSKPSSEDFDTSRLVDEDRSSAGLKSFLAQPDNAALKQLYGTKGAEEITRQLDAREVKQVCEAWIERHPDIDREEDNINKIVQRVRTNHPGSDGDGVWTVETLDEAYGELVAEGQLNPNPDHPKPLSDYDLLKVARLAGQGKLGDAIIEYLHCALPGKVWIGDDVQEIAYDPAYRELAADCCWYVFENSPQGADYRPDKAREFMLRYIGNRPVNLGLIVAAFKAFKDAQRHGEIHELMTTHDNDNATPDFNKMTDGELEAAMQSVNRHVNGKRVGQ